MLATLLYTLAAFIYFVVWFFAVARWYKMKEDDTWQYVPRFIRYALLAGLVPGLVLDVIFNATWGSIDYREWFPQEWTFSERTQRIARDGDHPRHRKALWWKEVLNHIEPDHIT